MLLLLDVAVAFGVFVLALVLADRVVEVACKRVLLRVLAAIEFGGRRNVRDSSKEEDRAAVVSGAVEITVDAPTVFRLDVLGAVDIRANAALGSLRAEAPLPSCVHTRRDADMTTNRNGWAVNFGDI